MNPDSSLPTKPCRHPLSLPPAIAALVFLFLWNGTNLLFAQGPLNPPAGSPEPNLKTLQQVEPRIDLFKAPANAVSSDDPDYRYVITQPGSYYFSSNLVVGGIGPPLQPLPKIAGIRIDANDVILDLNGFSILGSPLGNDGGDAITINRDLTGITIRNGAIRGRTIVTWTEGSPTANSAGFRKGVGASGGVTTVADLHVTGCRLDGILVWPGSIVRGCVVSHCGQNGISGISGIVSDCSVYNNLGSGIENPKGVIRSCIARSNGDRGIYGISSSVSFCVAEFNRNQDISAPAGAVLGNVSIP